MAAPIRARAGVPFVDRISKGAEGVREMLVASCIPHGSAFLVGIEQPGLGYVVELTGDHREINRTACSDLRHRTRAGALDQARQDPGAVGVCNGLEEFRIEEFVDLCPPFGSVPGGDSLFVYLRHGESI